MPGILKKATIKKIPTPLSLAALLLKLLDVLFWQKGMFGREPLNWETQHSETQLD